jgi:hypothetical protein
MKKLKALETWGIDFLEPGDILLSPNKKFFGILLIDGNFVVFRGTPDSPIDSVWANYGLFDDIWDLFKRTMNGEKLYNSFLTLQKDGNLVHYDGTPNDPKGARWSSGKTYVKSFLEKLAEAAQGVQNGNPDFYALVQDDGNLVIYKGKPGSSEGFWDASLHTTNFIPSIHGWQFQNGFKKSFLYNTVSFDWGFCAGMCIEALNRFKNNQDIKNIKKPKQGDPLFNTFYNLQLDFVFHYIATIYEWQISPDLSHTFSPFSSVGYRTREQWYNNIKPNLDNRKPVVICLIRARGYDIRKLSENHVVIAHSYYFEPGSNDFKLEIYDPNYPNNNDLWLSFDLTHNNNNNIHPTQNNKGNYRGFFYVES